MAPEYWLILGLVGIILLAVMLARPLVVPRRPPYRKKASLLNAAEQDFYRSLHAAVAEQWQIFARIPLADLVEVDRRTRRPEVWQRRIDGKSVDFVLCDPETYQPRLAILLTELSDESDDGNPPRDESDRHVDEALAAAGLPLWRVRKRKRYAVRELRGTVRRYAA